MAKAVEYYKSEYAVEKKALGHHSKLYCQKSWNSSVWTEIVDTKCLKRLLMDQMSQAKRVNNQKELLLRLSFG